MLIQCIFNYKLYSKLPHVLYTPDDTVCLFTKAEKKEALKLLEAKGVTEVTKVTPLHYISRTWPDATSHRVYQLEMYTNILTVHEKIWSCP